MIKPVRVVIVFITFEGIDGSGKSTQAKMFAKWLEQEKGRTVCLTKEPGGWDGGLPLRAMVTDGVLSHPLSELYLFLLDRAEHVAKVITPSLDSGADVVCERYQDSTIAYQVWGKGLDFDLFKSVSDVACFPVPCLTVLFDIPLEIALERVSLRGNIDSFESRGRPFMEKVRNGYFSLAQKEPNRWLVIKCGNEDSKSVFEKLLESLDMRGFFRDL